MFEKFLNNEPKVKSDDQKDTRTLSDVNNGESVRVECLKGAESDCQRLREMGFCEKAKVVKINDSGALLCKVCETRVVISQELAKNVHVETGSSES